MNERFKHDRHIIDLMLAHVPANRVEGAYNRAEHLERRIELAQEWANLLMVDQMPADELVKLRRRPSPLCPLIKSSISDCSQRTIFAPRLRAAS